MQLTYSSSPFTKEGTRIQGPNHSPGSHGEPVAFQGSVWVFMLTTNGFTLVLVLGAKKYLFRYILLVSEYI